MKLTKSNFKVALSSFIILIIISGCGIFKPKKDPYAPKPVKAKDSTEPKKDSFSGTELRCQKLGGLICKGCCLKPLFSSEDVTCCQSDSSSCLDRFQNKEFYTGIGSITIERFPEGNYGVWYGQKNKTFGVRDYVDAQQISQNLYKFVVEGRQYNFAVTKFGCGISTRKA